MKAMILAAGLGTRLKSLSVDKPKVLVPIGNKPVIDRVINYLKGFHTNINLSRANEYHRRNVNWRR